MEVVLGDTLIPARCEYLYQMGQAALLVSRRQFRGLLPGLHTMDPEHKLGRSQSEHAPRILAIVALSQSTTLSTMRLWQSRKRRSKIFYASSHNHPKEILTYFPFKVFAFEPVGVP